MAIPVLTNRPRRGDVLKYELNQNLQRQVITLAQDAAVYQVGSVLGVIANAVAAASVSVVAAPGNVGNGTLTKDATAPVASGAMLGTYRAVLTVAAIATTPAVPAQFTVYDPQGDSIGQVVVGGTFSGAIKFASTLGGTPFSLGDSFSISVTAGSGLFKRVQVADQADGSHNAVGVLLENVDATLGQVESLALVRGPAIVARHGLQWDATQFNTDPKKLPKILQLQALGIIIGEDY